MTELEGRSSRTNLFLAGLLFLALLLRLLGIQFGAPLTVHPDEHLLIERAREAASRMGNPNGFETPSGMVYVTLLLQGVRYLLTGAGSPAEYWSTYATDPFPFHLWGRALVALLGVLGVFAVFLLGREWDRTRDSLGLLGFGSTVLLAFHFLHLRDSRFATVDIPLATSITLVLWLLLRELHRPETDIRRMLGIAVCVGACCGVHYTAAPLIFPLFYVALANVVRGEGIRIDLSWLVGSGTILLAAVGLGFVAVTPYALFDSGRFWSDLRFLWFTSLVQPPIHGTEASFPLGYLQGPWMWGGGAALGLISFFGFMVAVLRRESEDRLLLAFAIPYFLMISIGGGVWGRLFLPLVPLQILWAVRFLETYGDHPGLAGLLAFHVRRGLVSLTIGVLALTTLIPSLRQIVLLRETDTRVEAAGKLADSTGPDDSVLLTPYSPPLPREVPRRREEGLLSDRARFDEGSRLPSIEISPLEDFLDAGMNRVLYSSYYWEAVQQPHVRKEYPGAVSYLEFLEDLQNHGREAWKVSPSNDPIPFHPENLYAPTFHLWRWLRPGPEIRFYELSPTLVDKRSREN